MSKVGRTRAQAGAARKSATVAMGFVTGLLSGLEKRGIECGPLLDRSGISRNAIRQAGTRVPLSSYESLFNEVARALDDEGCGLLSTPLRIGTFEFLTRSVVSSATLEEALRRMARFLRLVLPDLELVVLSSPDQAQIEIRETGRLYRDLDDPRRIFAFEWLLRLIHCLACWLVDRSIPLETVSFPYPRPRHAADYALIYTEHSTFSGKSLVATMPRALFDAPVRRQESAINAFIKGAPGKIAVLYRRDRELTHRVRDIIAQNLAEKPSLELLARELGTSKRTLQRKLAAEDMNLRHIRDEIRRATALARLERTQDSVNAIAEELGYSDATAFYRAFRGWMKVGPRRYRKSSAEAPPALKDI